MYECDVLLLTWIVSKIWKLTHIYHNNVSISDWYLNNDKKLLTLCSISLNIEQLICNELTSGTVTTYIQEH